MAQNKKEKREFVKGTHDKRALLVALGWLAVLAAVLVLLLYVLNGQRYHRSDTRTNYLSDGSYIVTEVYSSRFNGSYETLSYYDADGLKASSIREENGQLLSADFTTSGTNGDFVFKTVFIAGDGYTATSVFFDESGAQIEG